MRAGPIAAGLEKTTTPWISFWWTPSWSNRCGPSWKEEAFDLGAILVVSGRDRNRPGKRADGVAPARDGRRKAGRPTAGRRRTALRIQSRACGGTFQESHAQGGGGFLANGIPDRIRPFGDPPLERSVQREGPFDDPAARRVGRAFAVAIGEDPA